MPTPSILSKKLYQKSFISKVMTNSLLGGAWSNGDINQNLASQISWSSEVSQGQVHIQYSCSI